ncbi:hypothetical protein GGI25_001542 [Coemansia spiralis]|uniref:rRNA methyltransferase 1, mitochondrial n=2 Tax=Coemansia TaxID=4863 RepID=A0A9W8GAE3_9FUNG|nr:Alpha/beta knot methyltransferase [Coemansia spiralis]KAJ1993652.1 hypothetical protein EDC05_002045 [Coemansia umbellata]KAJ2622981.1 hypothetical protein GGI26_002782 [Coemansia sp. RSA 1358]KAJ2679407.1 hypothetical protein GGI25_001542 [Coemansia spiralis]
MWGLAQSIFGRALAVGSRPGYKGLQQPLATDPMLVCVRYYHRKTNTMWSKKRVKDLPVIADLPNSELLFGIAPIQAVLQSGSREAYALFYQGKYKGDTRSERFETVLNMAKNMNIPTKKVPKKVLDEAVFENVHQGLVLKVHKIIERCLRCLGKVKDGRYVLFSEENGTILESRRKYPLWLFLDRIQDPQNFGSILRSATFFGADGVVIVGREGCKPSPVVCKASSGAIEFIQYFKVQDPAPFFKKSKDSGWTVVCTTTRNTEEDGQGCSLDSLKALTGPTIIVLGNESDGISDSILQASDINVHIPVGAETPDMIDSLNVNVAAGIVLSAIKFVGE